MAVSSNDVGVDWTLLFVLGCWYSAVGRLLTVSCQGWCLGQSDGSFDLPVKVGVFYSLLLLLLRRFV